MNELVMVDVAPEGGCGCAVGAPSGWWAVLLVGLLLRRR